MVCEKVVVGAGTEYPLNGLLTLPDGAVGPTPAVVMVHGSGPSDMDERVRKLTPFKDLAQGLASHGIASLRYDKRTFAYGRKAAKAIPTVREETIEDALRATDVLRRDSRIDPKRIFVLGHSMGAMLAPRIDAEGADAAGLILMAATPYRLEDVVLRQLEQAGNGRPVLGKVFKLEHRFFGQKFDGLYHMSDEEARRKKFAGGLSLYYFKEMGQKTTVDYLLESHKPVLVLQGGKDVQVLATDDFAQLQSLLANRDNTTFRLYPELNHAFVDALYDDILKASKEFGTERHIGDEVVADIAAFVQSNGEG